MRLLLTALSLVLSAQTTTAKFDTKMIKRDPLEEGNPQGSSYGVTNTGDVPLNFDAADVVYGNVKKPVSLQFQVQVYEEGSDPGGG